MYGEDPEDNKGIVVTVIEELIRTCHNMAKSKGFWDSTNSGEKIALMHSELSELLEGIRHGDPQDEHCPDFKSSEIELADLIIRALDFAGYHEMNLAEAIVTKIAFNSSRPDKHGKKF